LKLAEFSWLQNQISESLIVSALNYRLESFYFEIHLHELNGYRRFNLYTG